MQPGETFLVLPVLAEEVNPLEHVVSHELFRVWGVGITNHMFMVLLAGVLMLIFLPLGLYRQRLVPRGFSNLLEVICVFLREEVARPFLGDKTDEHIGFIWTIFYFILTLNLLGMVPLGKLLFLITGRGKHFEGAATANIWVVGALAFTAFITIHVSGIRQLGLWGYIKNFAPSVPWPMVPLIYVMEMISALVRPFSLAIRLFANILAGHVVLATLLALIVIFKNLPAASASVFMTVPLSLLELLVAFLQAYIFTFLTTIFISFAVHPEH